MFMLSLFSCVYKLSFNHLMTLVLTKQWQMKRNVFVDFLCFFVLSFVLNQIEKHVHFQVSSTVLPSLSFSVYSLLLCWSHILAVARNNLLLCGCVGFVVMTIGKVGCSTRNYFAQPFVYTFAFIYIWKLIPVITVDDVELGHLRLNDLRPTPVAIHSLPLLLDPRPPFVLCASKSTEELHMRKTFHWILL